MLDVLDYSSTHDELRNILVKIYKIIGTYNLA